MDPIIQLLFSWQFVIFSLAIAAVVFVIRSVVEYLMETYTYFRRDAKLWSDLILPILPVFLGPMAAWLFTAFPYPNDLNGISSRVIFGLVAGLLSGLLYRVIKSLLSQKIQEVIPAGVTTVVPPSPVITTVTVENTPDATLPCNNPARPPIDPPSA